ncbi:MAG: DEAD/DEAH box helicase [Spirochaetaceae bacterium]|nr:MAG: DEAD/DEAH box helicase [Spirochaetaceae bacterium]
MLAHVHKLNKKRVQHELGPSLGSLCPMILQGRDFLVETGTVDDESLLIPLLLRVRKPNLGVQALIVRERPEDVERTGALLQRVLDRRGSRKRPFVVAQLGVADTARKETDIVARKPDIVVSTASRVIDHLRRDNMQLHAVRTLVIEEPGMEAAEGFNADIEFICSKLQGNPHRSVFVAELHEHTSQVTSVLRRPVTVPLATWTRNRSAKGGESGSHTEQQENLTMGKNPFTHVRKDPALKNQIKDILKAIHEDEDPEELNAYRAVINSNVSIFTRGYLAAYLLKQATGGNTQPRRQRSQAGNGRGPKESRAQRSEQRAEQREQRSEQPTSEASNGPTSSIFVSIGKNRKVYPKDLIQLFCGVGGLSADDVGQIKILDNYSFVEVATDKSDAAIETLNNSDFRGKKITVNYARKKD